VIFKKHSEMAGVAQQNKSSITLKGSAEIVSDYLNFGINSILFQRGLYPPETFQSVENYGLTILMSTDNKIKEFLASSLSQLKDWLIQRCVTKVALIITNVKTLEVLERWDFHVEYEGNPDESGGQVSEKPLKTIKNEIRDVLKQIASSVAYLPLLDCLCSFDIQIYTKSNVILPQQWSEAEAAHVKNAQSVKMRSFSTNIHKMETVVTYKNDD
jgi:mitotic spindle assembly checkpoint protein MAD2